MKLKGIFSAFCIAFTACSLFSCETIKSAVVTYQNTETEETTETTETSLIIETDTEIQKKFPDVIVSATSTEQTTSSGTSQSTVSTTKTVYTATAVVTEKYTEKPLPSVEVHQDETPVSEEPAIQETVTEEPATQETVAEEPATEEITENKVSFSDEPSEEEPVQVTDLPLTDDEIEKLSAIETECRDMIGGIERAYRNLLSDGADFEKDYIKYLRNQGIASEQSDRIQSLIFNRETGDIIYFTLSDREKPYCDTEIFSENDRYCISENGGISDISEIDSVIDVEKYVEDMQGNYAVYIGKTDVFTNYRIRPDMNSEQLLIAVNNAMPYLKNLDGINDNISYSDIYKFNLYELWWYVPASAGNALKKISG